MATCIGNQRVTTLDDLPKPCGEWQKCNKSKQMKSNAVLAFGILSVIASVVGGYHMGVFDLNYNPPERPADRPEKPAEPEKADKKKKK